MVQIALRGLTQNPFRYIATAIAIVLGVAFYVATTVMTTSFERTLNRSVAEAFADVDGAVRSTEVIETGIIDIRQRIPYETGDRIAEFDGVARAGAYLSGYAQVLTASGDVVQPADRAPQGFAWIDEADLSPYRLVDGQPPEGNGEIALDERTFADGGFRIGQRVRVLPLPDDRDFTVVGVIAPNGEGDGLGIQAVAFSLADAGQAFGTTDVDQVFVQAEPGLSEPELASTINAALRAQGVDDLEAVTSDDVVGEYQDTIGQVTTALNAALQIFASIALVVGAFVIYNTFAITVAQRRRDMALLRAIGASPRQVTRSVLAESLIVGIVASAVGALAGVGLGWALLGLLGRLSPGFVVSLTVPPTIVAAGIAIGVVNTIIAAYAPARRGAKIAPIEALRDSTIEQPIRSPRRALLGAGLLAVGVVVSIDAVTSTDLGALRFGMPATLLGIVLLGPAAVRPLSALIAAPIVRSGSLAGELARENAARNPKRTSTTALTLVIGVALVVAATVYAATVSASTRGQLEEQIVADHVVRVGPEVALLGGGLDPTVTEAIDALPEVETAVPFRRSPVEVQGGIDQVTGTDTNRLTSVLDLDLVEGRVSSLAPGEIAIAHDRAVEEQLAVGDLLRVRFPQQPVDLRVAGTYERDEFVGAWLVDTAVLEANGVLALDTEVFLRGPGTDGAGVAVVSDLLRSNPTAEVVSTASFIDARVRQIDQLLILLYGLLAMSVLVALIGIVNTMALSLHERTREVGLLRAVGMTPRQLRRTIRYESAIIALMGTVTGLALGMFSGWVAGRAAQDTFPDLTVPWTSLGLIAAAGALAGLAAGILPARRAGRLDVLDAIAGP